MRNKIFIGIFILLCVGMLGLSVYNVQSAQKQATSAKNEVRKQIKNSSLSKDAQVKASALTGLDSNRVSRDTGLFEEFCRTVFSWDGTKEYEAARKYAIDEMGIDANSQFMKDFFSPQHIDESGKGALELSDGTSLNMHYASLDYYKVTSIDGDKYSYLAEVSLTTDASYKDTEGNTKKVEGVTQATLTYTIDEAGQISDLKGYSSL